jgi:hypothetical protein
MSKSQKIITTARNTPSNHYYLRRNSLLVFHLKANSQKKESFKYEQSNPTSTSNSIYPGSINHLAPEFAFSPPYLLIPL